MYYTHTGKREKITFKKNGRYLKSGLTKANKFLADWRTKEQIKIDPRLLDIVWEVYRKSGSRKPIHIISSYRSPKTNAMLRRTRGGQAKKSQHMVGRALDFYLPDVSVKKLRNLGLLAQAGGVGYYPKSGQPFVHLDTGRVRHWPRMSRKELVKVFPKGKTLHVPSDGKALPGYQTAQANYAKRMKGGGAVVDDGLGKRRGGILTALFGGGRNDDDVPASGGSSAPARETVRIAKLPSRGPQIADRPGRVAPIRTNEPAEPSPLPGVDTGPEADVTETILASLPDSAPIPVFRPGATASDAATALSVLAAAEPKGEGKLTEGALVASASPTPGLRPSDVSTAGTATASLALAYAPTGEAALPRTRAPRAVATSQEVARRSLKREDELLAAMTRGVADIDPTPAKRPVLTENALRLAFARSSVDLAARRQEVLGKMRAAPVRGSDGATINVPLVPARPAVSEIDPAKINALAEALRRQSQS